MTSNDNPTDTVLDTELRQALEKHGAGQAWAGYLPMDCPICGRSRLELHPQKGGPPLVVCEKCTTSSEWDGFVAERYRPAITDDDRAALAWLREHVEWVAATSGPGPATPAQRALTALDGLLGRLR